MCYANHDFAHYLGLDIYQYIVSSMEALHSGLGDWFFRQAAFPELPDNAEAYFQRYFPQRHATAKAFKRVIVDKRAKLDQVLVSLVTKYDLYQADLVGFTSMFSQNLACFALARKIKEHNPAILTVLGGANCESPMGMELVQHVAAIDFVFSGPGLKSFPQFIQHCLERKLEKCHTIPGVFSKTNVAQAPGVSGEELDIDVEVALNYDAFLETIEKSFPNGEVKPILLFETSRGCWWGERAHCTFCGLNGLSMRYRAMQPEKATRLLQSLFQHTSKVSRLECVDNILPRSYLEQVFPTLNTPPNMYIFYEVKADLSEEDMQILSQARVKEIQPGIESLATSTLKLMKKGTSAFQNLRLLKNCLRYDIHPVWNLLVGFPGEGEAVYKKYVADIPRLHHLPPPTGVYPVRFDRFSPYFTEAKAYGLDLYPYDLYELIYPFTPEVLANIAYYFVDRNVGATYFAMLVDWFEPVRAKVDLWQSRWVQDARTPPPMLYLKQVGNTPVVYDSRAGEVIEYVLDDVRRQILEQLNRPKRLSDLVAALHIHAADLTQDMAFLLERGLIFEEDARFLNLLLPAQPPQRSVTS